MKNVHLKIDNQLTMIYNLRRTILLLITCTIFSASVKGQSVLVAPVLSNVLAERSAPNYISVNIEYPYYYGHDDNLEYSGDSILLEDCKKEGEFVAFHHLNGFKDSLLAKHFKEKCNLFLAYLEYYKHYFAKPPVKFDECVYFNPSVAAAEKLLLDNKELTRRFNAVPEAFRFYSVPQDSTLTLVTLKEELLNYVRRATLEGNPLRMHLKMEKPLSEFFRPFYFKKAVITNKEYREFVQYVKDSIVRVWLYNAGDEKMALNAYTDIDPPALNWKAKVDLNDSKIQEIIADLYKPEAERFYKRKEWDVRKFNYVYYTMRTSTRSEKIMINIYPDTLAWVHDFDYSYCEPMTNMYFWHPAYNDYPVVGITQKQALAFLNWKSEKEQKKLDAKGEPWIIKYELPAENEWEVVETADKGRDGQPSTYPPEFNKYNDKSYMTDLAIKENLGTSLTPEQKKDMGLDSANRPFFSAGNLLNHATIDWSDILKSYPPKYIKPSDADCNGVCFMGNVSEWMQETYKNNWLPVYNYQHKILECISSKESKILLETEDYFNAKNDTDGILVRGNNWYDQRICTKGGRNIEGLNTKVFVSPDSCHATIGFRYVIKLYRKDEKQIVTKIKATIDAKQ